MVNVGNILLFILLCCGGGLILNKRTMLSSFIFLFSILTVWLIINTLLENKCTKGGRLSLLNFLLTATVLIAIKTKSKLLFYICFEARVIPITLIVLYYGYQPEKLQASIFLLIYTVVSSLPLLLYIIKVSHDFVRTILLTVPITLVFIVKTPLFLLHT